MASVIHDAGGKKRIQFSDRNGKRKTIRLGKMTDSDAEKINTKVAAMAKSDRTGIPVADDVATWLDSISDDIHAKLAGVGLVKGRESLKLGAWLDKYIAGRSDLKTASIIKLEQTEVKLVEFFTDNKPLREITPDDAADWRDWLIEQELSEATIRTHARNAKTFFNAAIDRELLTKSPVRHLKSAASAGTNHYYVTPEEAQRVIDACPNLAWRVLFGLGRWAGLRTPSETHLLTWSDVDWERHRLTIHSPKTEHFAGKDQRIAPIRPELMVLLQEAFDAAEEGQERIVTISDNNLPRTLRSIIGRRTTPMG